MKNPKLHPSSTRQPMHYSVGAVIFREDKLLLLDRVKPPFGFACPAGHVYEEDIDQISAIHREVFAETGLRIVKQEKKIDEEVYDNTCSRGVEVHHWSVYVCEVSGEIQRDYSTAKSMGWFTKKEAKKLTLEPMWQRWLNRLKII
jgi:ADP-ribose pyrophosphatase YjhB (NUDIX family)